MAHLRPRRRLRRRGLPPGRHSQPRRSLLPGLAQRRPARLRSRSRSLARSRGGSATPRLPTRSTGITELALRSVHVAVSQRAFALRERRILVSRGDVSCASAHVATAAHSHLRFRSRNRFPLRSVPWVRSFLDALRRLGSHTGRTSSAGAPEARLATVDCVLAVKYRQEYAGAWRIECMLQRTGAIVLNRHIFFRMRFSRGFPWFSGDCTRVPWRPRIETPPIHGTTTVERESSQIDCASIARHAICLRHDRSHRQSVRAKFPQETGRRSIQG